MSIASAIQLKQQQVAAAYTACDAKGATMPAAGSQNLSNLASTISTISGGGPAPEPVEQGDVTFIDYDGTILYSYTFAEALALQALPANPSHSGLVAQGWNWTLAEIQACAATEDSVVAGQLYVTDDGKTRIYISIPDDVDDYPVVTGWSQTKTEGVVVDWGDGSDTVTVSGTGQMAASHIYSHGDFILTLEAIDGTMALGGNNVGAIANISSDEARRQSAIKKIEVGGNVTGFNTSYFRMAHRIETITMPQSATTRYPQAISCWHLKGFVLPRVTSLGGSDFEYCSSLKAVSIPPTLTSLPDTVFRDDFSLSVFGLGNVATLGNGTFITCTSLSRKIKSSKLSKLGGSAFQECQNINSFELPALAPTNGNNFYNTSTDSFKFSDNLASYPNGMFNNARGLKEWTVHNGVTTIPDSCFYNCVNLRKVTCHSGITDVKANAFTGCISLEAVILNSVTPPTLANVNALNSANMCPIYIPGDSLSAYKSATNWSTFKNRFRPWDYGESEYNVTLSTQVIPSLSGGTQYNPMYCVSDYIPLVEGHSYTFSGGVTDGGMSFCFYDSSKGYVDYYSVNANPRTITLNFAGAAYGRLTCRQDWLSRAFIYDDTTDELIWPVKKTS